ncbi:MAG: pilus assembly PilX family protein [Saezia sp.]
MMVHSIRMQPKEQGVVLIIALVLMVIITLSGLLAVRMSSADSVISSSMRARSQSLIAAEQALSFCKSAVFSAAEYASVKDKIIRSSNGTRWESELDNAAPTSARIPVTVTSSTANYAQPALCVIEDVTAKIKDESNGKLGDNPFIAYQITVRGFSANYEKDGTNRTGVNTDMQLIITRVV